MTQLDLLFLGSGNGFAAGGRYWSSFVLNERYLFDASPLALPHLKRAGIPPEDIDALFVTHFHADHFFGLPFLLLEYGVHGTRTKDFTIVGPPGIKERTALVTRAGFPNVFDGEKNYGDHYIDVRDGIEGEVAGLRYRARAVDHVEGLDCFGYRVELDGRTLAYSGDSKMCDALLDLADGADVFVVECSCWTDTCGPHLGPDDIRELRRRLGPKPAFVLTHLSGGEQDLGIENTLVADDLARFSL